MGGGKQGGGSWAGLEAGVGGCKVKDIGNRIQVGESGDLGGLGLGGMGGNGPWPIGSVACKRQGNRLCAGVHAGSRLRSPRC